MNQEPVYSGTDSCPCPYFSDGRSWTIEYIVPQEASTIKFHELLAGGYRRVGRIFYKNSCADCWDCIPIRLEVDQFILSKSQRRTANKNEDIRLEIMKQPSLSPEKVRLYNSYINTKHPDEKPEEPSESINTLINIHYGYQRTIELNFYLKGRLIGVGIVDEGDNALSSNYFYYDTEFLDRRLGIYSILEEINLSRHLGKKYYYLGFYIKDNKKMSYKSQFRPNQLYKKSKWEKEKI